MITPKELYITVREAQCGARFYGAQPRFLYVGREQCDAMLDTARMVLPSEPTTETFFDDPHEQLDGGEFCSLEVIRVHKENFLRVGLI